MKRDSRSNGKLSRRTPEYAGPPPSTWATDTPEFREEVEREAERVFGRRLDEMELEAALRDIMYAALANRLRPDPRDLPPWEPLEIPGFSFTEAVLEERYGADYVPPERRR